MDHPRHQRELQNLIDRLIDDRCDEISLAELNERLENDASFRRQYISCMNIEAEMQAMHAVEHGEQPLACDSAIEAVTPIARPVGGGATWMKPFVLAASFAAVAAASALLTYSTMRPTQDLAASAENKTNNQTMPKPGDVVAHITGTRDCRWGVEGVGTCFGAPLVAGQRLDLELGLAEITFDTGARVVLEGPSTFVVPGGQSGELLVGRMSAAIPRGTTGFTIRTPHLAISDSGTQYGLVAQSNGDTEIHVFEGPILARAMDNEGQETHRVELIATEGARLSPASLSFAVFRADGSQFVRTLKPSAGPTEGLLAFEAFDYPIGPLAWQNGGFGWAGPWADLEAPEDISAQEGAPTNGVAEGSLAGCELMSVGNRASQTAQQNRIRRNLSTSLRGVFDAAGYVENQDGSRLIGREGKTVYLSFLQRVSATNDVFYGFELHRGDGNANRVLCIGSGVEATGYGVTSNFNHQIDPSSYAPLDGEDTKAHLFVVRIDFGADNHDIVTVYRDPDSLLDEQQCKASARLEGNFSFDRVSIGNFNGVLHKIHEVDEVRLGSTFSAVTGQRTMLDDGMALRADKQLTNPPLLWRFTGRSPWALPTVEVSSNLALVPRFVAVNNL